MVTWLKVWVRTHFAFKKVLVLKNKISEIRLFIKCVNTVAGFGVCMSPLPNLNIGTVVRELMAGGDWGLGEGVWLNKLSDYRFLEYQPRVCDLADFEKNQHLEGSDLYLITYSSVGPQWVSCGCTPFLLAFS